ncbi:hypothetical protein [Microbacterium sp. Y-01]|uniref:hypothetical protein n=1 Tax=Microbacterium sp. Y-01 TaxID=2048898 RepID=UPI000F5F3771|nr:hypothetical protein [Microbacterium sp. Y-01]
MPSKFEIDDAIVLLLGAPVPGAKPGEIRGVTRLEKLIFLLERETRAKKDWLSEDANFEAYNFGPFSQKVYQSVDMLAAAGIVLDSDSPAEDDADTWERRNNISDVRDPYTTRDFQLTERGWRYYEALKSELAPSALQEIATFKRQFAFIPLRQLIRYVYTRYESFTTKSKIRDDVLGPKS